ncbi:MAG TPA: HIT family protein [Pyrinomonadaceae bacterium]|nr:HIT family protein [Pyrinomonadaceae bacterium]
MACLFCDIVKGSTDSVKVFEDDVSTAFLDHRPLFPGHSLLVPKTHFETLTDLPETLVGPLFLNAKLLARAVEAALGAEGTFVAMNNRVSQSVPHLHVHVVPRRKKDGLKGFFWPRNKYENAEHMNEVQGLISAEIARMKT